jgi:hypothetical protein
MTDPIEQIPEVQAQDQEAQKNGRRRGGLSVFTCPECGGSLWQVNEKEVVRFCCHVGHVYHGEALLAQQTEILEAALWTAVRTFKDKTVLARQLAGQERERGHEEAARRFEERAEQAEQYGNSVFSSISWAAPDRAVLWFVVRAFTRLPVTGESLHDEHLGNDWHASCQVSGCGVGGEPSVMKTNSDVPATPPPNGAAADRLELALRQVQASLLRYQELFDFAPEATS